MFIFNALFCVRNLTKSITYIQIPYKVTQDILYYFEFERRYMGFYNNENKIHN